MQLALFFALTAIVLSNFVQADTDWQTQYEVRSNSDKLDTLLSGQKLNKGLLTEIVRSVRNELSKECHTRADCPGDSDTCISNSCLCGSTEKCSGRTDTCVMGKCKCGGNEECSETEVCVDGECRDYCNPNPCQNGGSCSNTAAGAVCNCNVTGVATTSFTGARCQIALHCFDGSKSGDETGQDCGGSNCEPCLEDNPDGYKRHKCKDYPHYCKKSGKWYDAFRAECSFTCKIDWELYQRGAFCRPFTQLGQPYTVQYCQELAKQRGLKYASFKEHEGMVSCVGSSSCEHVTKSTGWMSFNLGG